MRGKRRELIDGKLQCGSCLEWFPVDEYSVHYALAYHRQSICRECQKEKNSNAKYTPHGEMSREKLIKVRARDVVNQAVRDGRLVKPAVCSIGFGVCRLFGSRQKVTGHHFDYGRKLDVVWLCTSCNKRYDYESVDSDIVVAVNNLIMENYPDVTEEEILRCRADASLSYVQLPKL